MKERTNQLNNNRNTNKQRNVYDVDEVSEKGERVYVLVCAMFDVVCIARIVCVVPDSSLIVGV